MKEKIRRYGNAGFLKWIAVFVVAVMLSVPVAAAGENYTVSVSSGYLALRTAKAYDASNEIGELYSGDTVQLQDASDSTYWYVYSPKHGKYGYVNREYLVANNSAAGETMTVSVAKGYLALRTAKAYDSRNEIGELYSGDTVQVQDTSDSTYWYVYSPKHGKYGYVNKDYLISNRGADTRTVKVDKGYLALRTAKAYDASNEIGELYTGDIVQIQDTSDSTYWYVYSPKHGKYGYVNKNYLTGKDVGGETRTVSVAKGYLALRTAKAYDASNEIGELYSGDTVRLQDTSDSTYWYVYSPKHDKYGYVNKNYLVGGNPTKTVSVAKGYLALRTEKAYDSANEIGQLYTGDTVEIMDTSDSTYWYVYSAKLGKSGYVNKDYLY